MQRRLPVIDKLDISKADPDDQVSLIKSVFFGPKIQAMLATSDRTHQRVAVALSDPVLAQVLSGSMGVYQNIDGNRIDLTKGLGKGMILKPVTLSILGDKALVDKTSDFHVDDTPPLRNLATEMGLELITSNPKIYKLKIAD